MLSFRHVCLVLTVELRTKKSLYHTTSGFFFTLFWRIGYLGQAFFLDAKLEPDWAQEFQNVEFLNKFLEFFHGNVLSFELFKEKCRFLVELVTKNDEKWGTPGFFLGFLSLFRLKIWKRFQYLEFLSKIVLEFWISWVFFSLSFCNFVQKKKPEIVMSELCIFDQAFPWLPHQAQESDDIFSPGGHKMMS